MVNQAQPLMTRPRRRRGRWLISAGDGFERLDLTELGIDYHHRRAPPTLDRSHQAKRQHWIRFRLRGEGGNPTGIGARVRLEAGGVGQTRWIEAGSGYAAQAPARAHFGLGDTTVVDAVEVTWPSDQRQRYNHQAIAMLGGIDRELTLVEESTRSQSMRNHRAPARVDREE